MEENSLLCNFVSPNDWFDTIFAPREKEIAIGKRLGLPFVRSLQESIEITLHGQKIICYQDGNDANGISGVVWDAGLYLVDFLQEITSKNPLILGKTLDIGCGTGICGLTALQLGATQVVFTDTSETTSLQKNIASLSYEKQAQAQFLPFNWQDTTNIPSIFLQQHWDTILCSDVLYDAKYHTCLLQFLITLSVQFILLSYKKRHEKEEKIFFQQCILHYHIYLIDPLKITMYTNIKYEEIANDLYLLILVPKR